MEALENRLTAKHRKLEEISSSRIAKTKVSNDFEFQMWRVSRRLGRVRGEDAQRGMRHAIRRGQTRRLKREKQARESCRRPRGIIFSFASIPRIYLARIPRDFSFVSAHQGCRAHDLCMYRIYRSSGGYRPRSRPIPSPGESLDNRRRVIAFALEPTIYDQSRVSAKRTRPPLPAD